MNDTALHLEPEEFDDDHTNTSFVREACRRVSSTGVLFGTVAGSNGHLQTFVAFTPEAALHWLCENVEKKRFLRHVNKLYSELDKDIATGSDDDEVSVTESRKRSRSGKKAPKQNHRHRKLDNDILQTVANSQDRNATKRTIGHCTAEEQRYRDFAMRLTGAGVDIVVAMISKAAAVATRDCLRDWQSVLREWRAQHRDGKRLFSGFGAKLPIDTDANGVLVVPHGESLLQSQLVLSQVRQERNGCFSPVETTEFKSLFRAAQKSQAIGIVGDMRHRWIMAAMFVEYEALEALMRQRANPSGGRGRGFATVAKEQLFGSVYTTADGTAGSRENSPSEWREFGHWLDYGKRWAMLQQRFGVGIFGLFPRSTVSNTFIERTLTMTRFTQWIDMIAECNDGVADMAVAIQTLFTSCMMEQVPPPPLFLEEIDDQQLAECDPLFAITSVEDSQRDVQDISDDIVIPSTYATTVA